MASMLPLLNKTREGEAPSTETLKYKQPKEGLESFQRKENQQVPRPITKAKHSLNEPRMVGGFKLSSAGNASKDEPRVSQKFPQSRSRTPLIRKTSISDLANQIKLIERKIKFCQKKIEIERRKKIFEEQGQTEDKFKQDFEKIIRKEMQLYGYQSEQDKNFDYLTNPGKVGVQQPEPEPVQHVMKVQPVRNYNIDNEMQKLQKFYQNNLKKKFERRQIFPHKACRRKTPKLYITQKSNALSKYGKPGSEQQHRFRVLTKQTTPQQIYPVIPNFAVVKDPLSKNIMAYLSDYRPFLNKTKEKDADKPESQQGQQSARTAVFNAKQPEIAIN